ncbi:unnamed protein product [Pedinophyceae sp. YPF-701]|nr:unnamed protein product [Pedinophyceae sp. YPF-701]
MSTPAQRQGQAFVDPLSPYPAPNSATPPQYAQGGKVPGYPVGHAPQPQAPPHGDQGRIIYVPELPAAERDWAAQYTPMLFLLVLSCAGLLWTGVTIILAPGSIALLFPGLIAQILACVATSLYLCKCGAEIVSSEKVTSVMKMLTVSAGMFAVQVGLLVLLGVLTMVLVALGDEEEDDTAVVMVVLVLFYGSIIGGYGVHGWLCYRLRQAAKACCANVPRIPAGAWSVQPGGAGARDGLGAPPAGGLSQV